MNIFEKDLYVNSYDSDCKGFLNIFSLFNYLQEVAGEHASQLSVGFDSMQSDKMFWVLSRIKVNIQRLPRWGDTIHVMTWPKGIEKLFFMRDFIVSDASGEVLVNATTAWLVVDTLKHRPLKPAAIPYAVPDNQGKFAIRQVPGKLSPAGNLIMNHQRTVSLNELDVNLHVNNAFYVQWLMDCYDLEFITSHQISSIQINYLEEMKYRDNIAIYTDNNSENPNQRYIEGIKTSDQNKALQAVMEWIPSI